MKTAAQKKATTTRGVSPVATMQAEIAKLDKFSPPAPAVVVVSETRKVAFRQIEASPTNPRKLFDEAELETLASSIAELGLLEPLLVREAFAKDSKSLRPDAFVIVAGERRWRAIGRLIATGRATPDYLVDVTIRKLTEREAALAAMAENVARKDLGELEEARRFKELRDVHKITTKQIAAQTGVTMRYVQQRIDLEERLAPEAKKALEAGKIKFSQARSLVIGAPRDQKEIVRRIESGQGWLDHARIRDELTRKAIPIKHALFDRALYKGEIIAADPEAVGDDVDEVIAGELFADHKAFWELQNAAVSAKVDALKKAGAKVEVFQARSGRHFHNYDYAKKPKDPKAFTAVAVHEDGQVEIVPGLVSHAQASSSSANKKKAQKADPLDNFVSSHKIRAHVRKTYALQNAILGDPLTAQRILCATLLVRGGLDGCRIMADRANGTFPNGCAVDAQAAPEVFAELAKLLEPVKKHVGVSREDGEPASIVRVGEDWSHGDDEKATAAVWNYVAGISADKVGKLLAALVAHQVGTWSPFGSNLGDDESAIAIAEHVGVAGKEAKHGLALQAADLVGLRKPILLTIAKDLLGAKAAAELEGKTGKQITGAISLAIDAGKAKAYVLPTFKFADDAAAEAAAKRMVKE